MASASFSVLRLMWPLITSRHKCCRDRGLPGGAQTHMKCLVAYLTSHNASFSQTQWMELKFYSVCEKCPPTRAGPSRSVWGLDRSWHGWHSPGAWLPRCQPDVSAMSPRQSHRTEREKITGMIYCWLIGSWWVDWCFYGFYICLFVWTGSYRDDFGLTVYLIGLVMDVSPGTINFCALTMAALETPVIL